MTKSGRLAGILLSGALLTGCATVHSLTPVSLDAGPAIREYKSPDLAPFKYVTFSVYPLAVANPSAQLKTEADQRAVLFSVRNLLESNGYRFVRMSGNPDFVVGVDASIERVDRGQKPVLAAPEWKPGETLPSPPASVAALAVQDAWGWGTMPDPAGLVAQLPGWPPRGKTRVASTSGRWKAAVTLSVLDGKSMAEVWVGTGVGLTRNRDIRIASQLVAWAVVHQFPETAMAELNTKGGDLTGLGYEILTNDGVSFYPGAVSIEDKSQAWKTGIMPYDMVLAVGGEAAWDRTWIDVRRMLAGPPDSRMALTLWRDGDQVNVEARRVPIVSEEEATAVAAPPLTEGAPVPRKQAILEIPRTTVAIGRAWAILGVVTIGALVAAIFTAMK